MPVVQGRGFFVSGGTLPLNSASYIERSADRILYDSLLAGRFCYVLSPRQMGKSSLSIHTIARLEAVGVRTAFLDLTSLGGKNVTVDQWYAGLAMELARELDLVDETLAYFREHAVSSPIQRFFGLIREVFLGQEEAPLVIFIDEIDTTRSLPFDADEFFAGIRECFNRRVNEPKLNRLTFCLLGVAVPSDLIRNPATTPFNIGERIILDDFTPLEFQSYANELGPLGSEIVARVHYWTGGHPYLSQGLCRSIAASGDTNGAESVDEIVARELFNFKARSSNINLADVANIALHYGDTLQDPLKFRADLLSAYSRVLAGRHVPDDESNRVAVLLKLSGIVRSDGRRLRMRNRVYEHVFDRKWIAENMPEQELRRQKQSYRRGVVWTAIASGAILAGLMGMAGFMYRSHLSVIAAKRELDYQLYVADISRLRLYFESGDTARIEAIFERQRNSPYHGFEWGYWLDRYYDSAEVYSLDYRAPGKREGGRVSQDGSEVCIIDSPSMTATIVDRHTKKVVATMATLPGDTIYAAKSGWRLVRSNGDDRTVFDVKTGRPDHHILGPRSDILSLAKAEHEDILVTTSPVRPEGFPRVIRIVDLNTDATLFTVDTHKNIDPETSISADGRYIYYVIRDEHPTEQYEPKPINRAVLFDWKANKVIDEFTFDSVQHCVALAPNGDWMLYYNDERSPFLRNTSKHISIPWKLAMAGILKSCTPLSDGHTVVTLYEHGLAAVSDIKKPNEFASRQNAFEINPGGGNGRYITSSTLVRVNYSNQPAGPTIVGTGNRVTHFAPGQLNLFQYDKARIRHVTDGDFERVSNAPDVNTNIEYTYNGRWTMVPVPNSRRVMLTGVSPEHKSYLLPYRPVIWACGIEPDHVALWDPVTAKINMYSARTGNLLWSRARVGGLNAMWISPDGSRLILNHTQLELEVYDTTTGEMLGKLSAHNVVPLNVSFCADGRHVFTCGGDGRAVLWDLATLGKVQEFQGNALDTVTSADLSPDETRVVTTSRAGTWQLWDAVTGTQLMDVQASPLPLISAVFSTNGKKIITAGDDNKVRLWTTVEKDPTVYIPVDPSRLPHVHS